MSSNAMHNNGFPPNIAASVSSPATLFPGAAVFDFDFDFDAAPFSSSSIVVAAAAVAGTSDSDTEASASCGGNRLSPLGAQNPPGPPSSVPAFSSRFSLTSASLAASSSSTATTSPTRIQSLRRTFALKHSEYFRRSGHDGVRPLNDGKNMFILGPASFGAAAGNASEHSSPPASSTSFTRSATRFSRRARNGTRPHRFFVGLSFFHQPRASTPAPAPAPPSRPRVFSAVFSAVVSANDANADGSPHVFTPCARAVWSFTNTFAAHAHDVGGFQTKPPNATSSSNVPAGESSYRAR
mmetsp:Transcript_4482/g.15865  ORF Transcript_4482/g.15865 Transcript_4482/m.15865 type:complete len:296 (-) Transcript_4482:354-1241(-)